MALTPLSQSVGRLDESSSLPLDQQLQRALRRAIETRVLGPDDALPPERDLAEGRRSRAGSGRGSGRGPSADVVDVHAMLEQIGSLEEEQKHLSRLMGDPELYRDAARARETVRRYEEVNAELESLYARLTAAEEGAGG